jgi:hypothetical protein
MKPSKAKRKNGLKRDLITPINPLFQRGAFKAVNDMMETMISV